MAQNVLIHPNFISSCWRGSDGELGVIGARGALLTLVNFLKIQQELCQSGGSDRELGGFSSGEALLALVRCPKMQCANLEVLMEI